MECLLPYLCMVAVPHIMVGLERMLNYRGVGLERYHCIIELYLLPVPMIRTAVGEEETLLADMSEEMHALTEGITDINSKSLHQYTTLLHVSDSLYFFLLQTSWSF